MPKKGVVPHPFSFDTSCLKNSFNISYVQLGNKAHGILLSNQFPLLGAHQAKGNPIGVLSRNSPLKPTYIRKLDHTLVVKNYKYATNSFLPHIQQKMYDDMCDCNATHDVVGLGTQAFFFGTAYFLPTLGIKLCTTIHGVPTHMHVGRRHQTPKIIPVR